VQTVSFGLGSNPQRHLKHGFGFDAGHAKRLQPDRSLVGVRAHIKRVDYGSFGARKELSLDETELLL